MKVKIMPGESSRRVSDGENGDVTASLTFLSRWCFPSTVNLGNQSKNTAWKSRTPKVRSGEIDLQIY